MKGPALFQGEIIRNSKITMTKCKNLLFKNHWTNFNQTWHNASFGEGDSNLFKCRALSFSKGKNNKIVKIHLRNLKIFFYRTSGQISTKLGTKHPWVKRNLIHSNEGPCPLPRGDNYQIAKIH